MALESEQVRVAYAGNGSSTNFSFPWYFLDATDLDVYLVDEAGTVLGTPGAEFLQPFVTNYDVIGNFNALTNDFTDFSQGASVNFVAAPAIGYSVVIIRNNPDTQDTSLTNNQNYSGPVLETAMDKIVMMVQYLVDRSSRSLRMSDANPQTFNPVLPNPITANASLCVDPTGTSLIMGPTVTSINGAVTSAAAAAASAVASANSAAASAVSATAAAVSAGFVGAGAIADTAFTLVNNQIAPANVTGLFLNPLNIRSAEIDIHVYRNTTGAGATELCSRAKYIATFKTVANSWDLSPQGAGGDIDAGTGQPGGVTISITSAGQVQYTSTNISGTPASSVLHFRATTMGV